MNREDKIRIGMFEFENETTLLYCILIVFVGVVMSALEIMTWF